MKISILVGLLMVLAGIAQAESSAPQNGTPGDRPPVLASPIRWWQTYLSGADGHRCPMTPSCSSYALQAMQRHGSIKGWIMTCDRLMRCGRDELKRTPPVMTRNGIRCPDPIDNNDFWMR